MLLWSAPPPWGQCMTLWECHSSLCSRSFSISVMCLNPNLPVAGHLELSTGERSRIWQVQGAGAPWSLPAALADPRKAPGWDGSAGCSHACRGCAFPSHPRGATGGSDPPDTAFADIWSLLFVFGLVWEGSTLNSWSFQAIVSADPASQQPWQFYRHGPIPNKGN